MLVTLLLFMVADANRRGYRHIIDAFWDEARSFDLPLPCEDPVSAPAFCKARHKLDPELVRALLHRAADTFDDRFGADQRWFGRRVFGIDGSKVNLRRDEWLADTFGVPQGAYCPQILVSTLFDLVAKVPHDIAVASHTSSEREQMVHLLDRVRPGDVVVLDRGYPSFEVLCMLVDAGIDFVMRVPAWGSFAVVKDLIESGGDDYQLLVEPPDDSPMKDHDAVTVRALRVQVPENQPTILFTSLPKSAFTRKQIAELYRKRWEVEEFYKLAKSDYLGQRQFHAQSPHGIEQEVYSLALFVAMTRYLMATAAETHDTDYQCLSPKSGVLGLGAYVVRLFLASGPEHAQRFVDHLLLRIIRTRDPTRPGRRWPRRSFKPARKWGPKGRRGG